VKQLVYKEAWFLATVSVAFLLSEVRLPHGSHILQQFHQEIYADLLRREERIMQDLARKYGKGIITGLEAGLSENAKGRLR